MKFFLEWLIKKAETTFVGKWLTIITAISMIVFLMLGIYSEPKILIDIGKMLFLAIGGLLVVVVFRLFYLFLTKKKNGIQ